MKESEPIKITVTPYHKEEDDMKGKLTKILLYPNKLEYKIKFDFKVPIDDDIKGESKVSLFVDEEGFINKQFIGSISKFIDNDASNDETSTRPVVEVGYSGGQLVISCNTEEERNNLYKKLNEWYWNEQDV